MDVVTGGIAAQRVRTVLDRAWTGHAEFGRLRRPLCSVTVRTDGTLLAVVDTEGMAGTDSTVPAVLTGNAVTLEVPDTVCLGTCADPADAPSFALDGRSEPGRRCTPACTLERALVRVRGVVQRARACHGGEGLTVLVVTPVEALLTGQSGVDVVPRAALLAAAPDPVAAVEEEWLRRLNGATSADGPGATLARRVAVRSGRADPDVRPLVVGVDRRGVTVAVRPLPTLFREDVRAAFPRPLDDAEELPAALDALARPIARTT